MNGQQLTLDRYFIEAAMDAKREGLDAAAASVTSTDDRVVLGAIGNCAPGSIVTANTLREVLDIALVSNKSRPPMMRKACRVGLLEPVIDEFDGMKVHRSIPSTGASANGAHVKVYRRTAAAWAPAWEVA